MSHDIPLQLLGGLSAQQFLRDYWQRKPLLVRQALPDFVSPVSPDELAGLALEEEIESRLILEHGDSPWELRRGPFAEDTFSQLPERDWTLLVQAVDQFVPEVAELLEEFRFLPSWRIDDVMVSFATPGGGVGPHFDNYDVFLIQGHGRRRWRVGQMCDGDSALLAHPELRILADFQGTDEWVLEPGDMLYLPPGVPHHGVAVDHCLTFSVGMRAPSAAELLGDFVDTLAADATDTLRFRDPDLAPPKDPNEIDATAMARVVEALNLLRMNDPDQLGDWFGGFITTYRSAVEPAADESPRPRIEVEWDLAHGATLQRHPWSRMAWRKAPKAARLYAGGRVLVLPTRDAQRLAAAETVDSRAYDALTDAGRDAVFDLLDAGHYRLSLADDDE